MLRRLWQGTLSSFFFAALSSAAVLQDPNAAFQRDSDRWLNALGASSLTRKAIELDKSRNQRIEAADTAWIRARGRVWHPQPVSSARPFFAHWAAPIPEDPVASARFRWVEARANSARRQAVALLNAGKAKQASLVLENLMAVYRGDAVTSELLFDAQIQSKDYRAAYNTVMPVVLRSGMRNEPFSFDLGLKMRASLASALVDQVFGGQKRACFNAIGYGIQPQSEYAGLYPRRNSAAVIAAMSSIALAALNGHSPGQDMSFYADFAQRLDPDEPMFDQTRAKVMAQRRQVKRAEAILESAERSAFGLYRVALERQLASIRTQAMRY